MNFATSEDEIDMTVTEEFVAEQKYPTYIEQEWVSDSDENTCDDAEPILEQVIETPVVERKIKKKQQRPTIRIPVTNLTRKGKGKRKSTKKDKAANEEHARRRVVRSKTENKKNVEPESDPITEDCDWITKQLQAGVVGSVQQVVDKMSKKYAARRARQRKNQDKRINKRVREAVVPLKRENKGLKKKIEKLEAALQKATAGQRKQPGKFSN